MARQCVRGYARWTHRQPTKIYYPELQPNAEPTYGEPVDLGSMDNQRKPKGANRKHFSNPKNASTKQKPLSKSFDFDEIDKLTHSFPKNKSPEHPVFKIKPMNEKKNKPPSIIKEVKRVFYEDGNFVFDRLPDADISTSNLLMKLKSKKDHGHCGLILVEGWRLINDGLQAGCVLKKILFSQTSDLEKIKGNMPKEGPEIYKMPYKELKLWSNLDTCPGIMAIFNTPRAENIKKSKNRLPINIICDNIRDPGNLGAILRASLGVGCNKVLLTKGCVNIWDQKVLRSAAGAHFRLPMFSELTWKDIADHIEENTSVFIADNKQDLKSIIVNKPQSFFHGDRVKSIDKNDDEPMDFEIPLLPYYEANFSSQESIALIIGGETEGVSEGSYRFAHFRNGVRINIPLFNGVDSLNTGMALAVIAFEMKRQMLTTLENNTKIIAKNH